MATAPVIDLTQDDDDLESSPVQVKLSDFVPRKEKAGHTKQHGHLNNTSPDLDRTSQEQLRHSHDGAPGVKHNGTASGLFIQHDGQAEVKSLQNGRTSQEEKAIRRAAKQARRARKKARREAREEEAAAARGDAGLLSSQRLSQPLVDRDAAVDFSIRDPDKTNELEDVHKAVAPLLSAPILSTDQGHRRLERNSIVESVSKPKERTEHTPVSVSTNGHQQYTAAITGLANRHMPHRRTPSQIRAPLAESLTGKSKHSEVTPQMPPCMPKDTAKGTKRPFEVGDRSSGLAECAKRPRGDLDQHADERFAGFSSGSTRLVDVTDACTTRITYSSELEDTLGQATYQAPLLPATRKTQNLSDDTIERQAHKNGHGPHSLPPNVKGPSRNGLPYSEEEDTLLKKLKEVDSLGFDQIADHFNGRTQGSLQTRYYTKLAHHKRGASAHSVPQRRRRTDAVPESSKEATPDGIAASRSKRVRKSAVVGDGFVSWLSLKHKAEEEEQAASASGSPPAEEEAYSNVSGDRVFPHTLSRSLRSRELGVVGRRAWNTSGRFVTEEFRNHVLNKHELRMRYQGTSGDVVALCWCPQHSEHRRNTLFAAGSIAISDDTSMQYNMQRNLLVGNTSSGELQELTEHHVPRPTVHEGHNVNGLHAMRASQDPRLFLTVTATEFSRSGDQLFTTGTDKMLRRYSVSQRTARVKHRHAIEHSAPVDLLSVYNGEPTVLATGCRSATNSINLYKVKEGKLAVEQTFSPGRRELQTSVPIFPSALKWGVAEQHKKFLLAGFSGDEEKERAGEFCLWNAETGQALMSPQTPNVFDVAWNPNPSSASVFFAVASKPAIAVDKGMRSAIQCFAPDQGRLRRTLTWQCPALDINDLTICPHDDRLIAAGSTDGTVYVWDQRWVSRSQQPLHILRHGKSENVLAHDRDKEQADTGVRFLSWGATSSRLYSGSSDGIVKVWNPYKTSANAHIEDIEPPLRQRAAIMSGTFSSDYRDLLIGTENGQINLFSTGGDAACRTQSFHLRPSIDQYASEDEEPFVAARSMLDSNQVELRPCGAMPFRQAVQGPRYNGPYLAPSAEDLTRAEEAYRRARSAQHEADVRHAQSRDGINPSDDPSADKAFGSVRAAQQALEDLSQRSEYWSFAHPKAEQFQAHLLGAERRRQKLEARMEHPIEQCSLDCRFLPRSEEPEDSHRSELRIPWTLRSIAYDAAAATGDEDSKSCMSCFPTVANLRAGRRCAACKLKKSGLTAVCSQCSGPARMSSDDGTKKKTVCERCAFACFRCGGQTETTDFDLKSIKCSTCNLTWEAGVLGYELTTLVLRPKPVAGGNTSSDEGDIEADCELADTEIEHYASFWKEKGGDVGWHQT